MPARRFTDVEEEAIAERYRGGESLRSIGRGLGTDHTMLANALRRRGAIQREAPERNRLYSLDAHTFDAIDSEAKAYWLGFLFADGNVSRRSLIVGLAGVDGHHLQYLADLCKSTAPVALRDLPGGYKGARLELTDRHLAARLLELGIEPHRPRPLATMEAIPAALFRHWLRGFFDGDGSVKIRKGQPAASFCGNPVLLSAIRDHVADSLGGRGSLYPHSKSAVWYLGFSGRKSCTALYDYLYVDATVYLARKRDRFLAIPTPAANHWERPRSNGRWRKANDD